MFAPCTIADASKNRSHWLLGGDSLPGSAVREGAVGGGQPFAEQKSQISLFVRTAGVVRAAMKIGMANLADNLRSPRLA